MKKETMNLKPLTQELEQAYIQKVKENGFFLKQIPHQTEAICLAAVEKNGLALDYVRHQTEAICLKAINHRPAMIRSVKKQTPHICSMAVQQDGLTLIYVKKQTPEICLEAVKENGKALKYVKKQTPDICLEAVRQDGRALRHVKKPTFDLCFEAVKSRGDAFDCVELNRLPLPLCFKKIKGIKSNVISSWLPSRFQAKLTPWSLNKLYFESLKTGVFPKNAPSGWKDDQETRWMKFYHGSSENSVGDHRSFEEFGLIIQHQWESLSLHTSSDFKENLFLQRYATLMSQAIITKEAVGYFINAYGSTQNKKGRELFFNDIPSFGHYPASKKTYQFCRMLQQLEPEATVLSPYHLLEFFSKTSERNDLSE